MTVNERKVLHTRGEREKTKKEVIRRMFTSRPWDGCSYEKPPEYKITSPIISTKSE